VDIRDHAIGSAVVITLDGRLTVDDRSGRLKEAVQQALGRGAADVILDLGGVRYVDSTRLGELIGAHVTVSRIGGRLKLAATPARVVELLTMAGLDRVFERFDTVEEAAASLQLS
jgi:anti-anti-sigma factor